jgi:hypothetical protein
MRHAKRAAVFMSPAYHFHLFQTIVSKRFQQYRAEPASRGKVIHRRRPIKTRVWASGAFPVWPVSLNETAEVAAFLLRSSPGAVLRATFGLRHAFPTPLCGR